MIEIVKITISINKDRDGEGELYGYSENNRQRNDRCSGTYLDNLFTV